MKFLDRDEIQAQKGKESILASLTSVFAKKIAEQQADQEMVSGPILQSSVVDSLPM